MSYPVQPQRGQVWASTDRRDAQNGRRQERIVVEVPPFGDSRHGHAFLFTPGSRFHGAHGVRWSPGKGIERHRFVRMARPDEMPDGL